MSNRKQPYLPLYVQDFLTDEKLMECSAQATGIYIRIMCIMHKSETYGKILLKQNYKQRDNQFQNFALYFIRFMPYSIDEISIGLSELVSSGVLQLEGDTLIQKRMVRDNEISIKRSISGSKGGKVTQSGKHNKKEFDSTIANNFAKAKNKANSEIEIDIENENENVINNVNKEITQWEKSKLKFLNSNKWKQKFCAIKNITLTDLETQMNKFIELVELRNDYKTPKALYNHFTNYYNKTKQDEADKRINTKSKFGTAIREAGNRMGEIGNTFGKEIA